MRMKKATAFGLAALMAATMLPAVPAMAKGDDSEGSVYYLNFKPEQADQWSDLAKKYTDETGVPVTVVTAASGTYESTLKSEMAKDEVPTLFQVNGPVGLASWKDYCYDLKDSDVYKNVESDDFVLKEDSGAVDGIAYVIETYGIIYNKALLKKYCEMDGAVIKSADEINNFETLKKVADDIQAKKDDLGVDGAFTSAGFDSSSDWRFKTHLANLPIYYEYQADGIDDTDAIKGTYLDNYKNVFDLYITDSTCDGAELSAITADDSRNEFINGEAVFYQNGSWEYGELSKTYSDDELAMIPIYFGVDDENEGLATGTENFWCVNKEASEEDIQATLDFMNWCVTSEEGTKMMCGADGMGFVIPFKNNLESENPLVNIANDYMEKGYTPVDWTFSTMPSEQWKNDLGSALTTYAADQTDANWKLVQTAFVDGWAKEAAAATK